MLKSLCNSDVPVYASPGLQMTHLSDLEGPKHKLALASTDNCDIIAAFRNAERQAGQSGVYIDPMLRKSYKGLAPLP